MGERGTATYCRDVNPDHRGDQRLYRVEPPHMTRGGLFFDYVVVSAAATSVGPETYIFPAFPSGVVAGWTEMPGSVRGVLDHDAALTEAGYTPIYNDTKEN